MEKYYWFKGMKFSFGIISDCLNVSRYEIRKKAEQFNMSVQQYIKSIENCKPREAVERKRVSKNTGGKKSNISINGMCPLEISRKYNIPKSTIYSRYKNGARTLKEIIKGE